MYEVGLRNMTELMDTPALALWRSSMSFRSFAWPLLSDMYSSLRILLRKCQGVGMMYPQLVFGCLRSVSSIW